MKTKKVLRKRRMAAARRFSAAARREQCASARAAAYVERLAMLAAKEADRLASLSGPQSEEGDG